jgi:Ser-tRNA(Ala) deacylase AlaX
VLFGIIAAINRERRRVAIKYANRSYAVVAIQSEWSVMVGDEVSGFLDERGSADLARSHGESALVYIEASRCSADEALKLLR